MTQEQILWTFQTAAKYGGGFMQRLAAAGIAADADNKAKILQTWPEIVSTYGPSSVLYETPGSFLTLVK